MTKLYSEDLRLCAVEAVANGMSRRQAAKVFKVGASSVRWAELHDQTGGGGGQADGRQPRDQHRGIGSAVVVAARRKSTGPDPRRAASRAGRAAPPCGRHCSVWRFFHREKLSLKKKSARGAARQARRR
jgi:transposase